MDALIDYAWPGNVRELENLLTRAVVLSKGHVLLPDHMLDVFEQRRGFQHPEEIKPLSQVEREHVARVLTETRWNKGRACELLGISRPTLREKIKKYKLHP